MTWLLAVAEKLISSLVTHIQYLKLIELNPEKNSIFNKKNYDAEELLTVH